MIILVCSLWTSLVFTPLSACYTTDSFCISFSSESKGVWVCLTVGLCEWRLDICHTFRQRGWEYGTGGSPPGLACQSDPHTGRQVNVPLPHPAAGLSAHCKWTAGRIGGRTWGALWSGWRSPQEKHLLHDQERSSGGDRWMCYISYYMFWCLPIPLNATRQLLFI